MTNTTDPIKYSYHVYAELTDLIRLATTLQANLKRQSQEKENDPANSNGLSRCDHNIATLLKMQAGLAKLQDQLQANKQAKDAMDPDHSANAQVKTMLETLLQVGRWHGTFWQVLKKRIEILLKQPRDNVAAEVSMLTHHGQSLNQTQATVAPKDDTTSIAPETTCVFMHLYQATGKSLTAWLPQLHNLRQLAQSRPIYTDRSDVLAVFEARDHVSTDAYVAINLPADVLTEPFRGQMQTDKYGHTLATLDMDNWPAQPNIDYFYHQQQIYHLRDNELVRAN